jgi:hypothetical protein
LGESDACCGYFPSGAGDDVASASVLVTVGRNELRFEPAKTAIRVNIRFTR